MQPPIITSSDCEGAGEVFTVSTTSTVARVVGPPRHEQALFFRDPKFLTVSSQLHLEAFVHEHKKVWSLSPTFRAEKSDTARHLSEFWMLEAEIQTESLHEVISLVENMIRSLVAELQGSKIFDEIISVQQIGLTGKSLVSSNLTRQRWDGLLSQPWPRITYSEAIHRLQLAVEAKDVEFEFKPSWSAGLQLEHERFIAAEIGSGSPVFVTSYPQNIKPFYMLPSTMENTSGESATTACFDLLLPDVCEVVGGSLREHRAEHLIDAMHRDGSYALHRQTPSELNSSSTMVSSAKGGNLDWYVDLRRFGSVPHGGFGLGLDRLISYLAGVHNIKDVVPWPRWHGRCDC